MLGVLSQREKCGRLKVRHCRRPDHLGFMAFINKDFGFYSGEMEGH